MPRALLPLILLLVFAPAAQATVRYAATDGTGTDCTQPAPCPLPTALTGSVAGDEVVVDSGTYSGAFSNTTLTVPTGVAVRGAVVGPDRPVVEASLKLDGADTRVSDLELRRSGNSPALQLLAGAAADRVIARQTETDVGKEGCGVTSGSTIRNSVCQGSDPDASAGLILNGGTARNVTAIGAFLGLYANGASTIEATIAQGAAAEDAQFVGTDNVLRDVLYVDSSGPDQASNTGRVLSAATFRGGDDYRQDPGSVSVDQGDLEDASTGASDLDLNGNLRLIGTHVDLGAYEQPPAPAAVAGANTVTTSDGATFAGTTNTGGGRAQTRFEYGTGFASISKPQILAATLADTPRTAIVTGLDDTPTPYRLVVTTDGGTTRSADQLAYRAPTLTQSDPTAVTDTTATLHGSVDLRGAPSATVEFVYGGATSPPQTITANGPVQADVTGLYPRNTYDWKLRVTRGTEIFETPYGRFTTASAPPAATPSPSPSASPSPTASPAPTFTTGSKRKAGRRLLRVGKLKVTARCGDLNCSVRASGRVSIGKKRYGPLAAPKSALALEAGERGTITLTANRRLRKRVRHYLERHPKARATIRVKGVVTDADGRTVKRVTIRVRA